MVIFKAEETALFIPFTVNLNRGLKRKKNKRKYLFSLESLSFQVYLVTDGTLKKTLKRIFRVMWKELDNNNSPFSNKGKMSFQLFSFSVTS